LHQYEHDQVHLSFVACRPSLATPGQVCSPFRWVRRDELRRYEFPSANAAVLDLILES
jgi:hypothetical protein